MITIFVWIISDFHSLSIHVFIQTVFKVCNVLFICWKATSRLLWVKLFIFSFFEKSTSRNEAFKVACFASIFEKLILDFRSEFVILVQYFLEWGDVLSVPSSTTVSNLYVQLWVVSVADDFMAFLQMKVLFLFIIVMTTGFL